ncbi:MAG: hypothetical protein HY823_10140 [Acidobacteria bacterium]|nr:hypothetical protein [Acidobacteriota bacterium]
MRILAAFLIPAALVAQAPAWDGNFVFDPARSDDVAAVVKTFTDPMNFAVRLVWRKKLESSEKPPQNLSLLKGSNLTLGVNKEVPFTAGPGNPAKWKRADGESFLVSFEERGDALSLVFAQDDVKRTWKLGLDAEGRVLTVEVTLENPKLPGPLRYRLQYRKAG